MLTVVYVLGVPRCGSTVLGTALGGLPGAVNVGELGNLWRLSLARPGFTCGCGDPFVSCAFWQQVLSSSGADRHERQGVMARQRDEIRPAAVLRGMGRAHAGAFVDLVAEIYKAVARTTGCDVIIDTSKKPWYAAGVSQALVAQFRGVHLVRDPRGHVVSRHRGWRGAAGTDHALDRPMAARTVLAWTKGNIACDVLSRRSTPRLVRVRYEDFVVDPLRWLRAISAVLPEPRDVNHIEAQEVSVGVQHTAAGNPVRRTMANTLQLRLDDQWRQVLTRRQQATVFGLGLPLTARYGYRPTC